MSWEFWFKVYILAWPFWSGEAQMRAPDSFRRLVQDGPTAAPAFGGAQMIPPTLNGGGGSMPPNISPTMGHALGDTPPPGLNPDQKMGFWFQKIMASMQSFEQIKPRFASVRNLPPDADMKTQRILTGQESETLHLEFLRLQQKALSLVDEQTNSFKASTTPQELEVYLGELETFAGALNSHIAEVTQVLDRALTNLGQQNVAPGGVGMSGGGGGSMMGSTIRPDPYGGSASPNSNAGAGGMPGQNFVVGGGPSRTSGVGVGVGVPIELPKRNAGGNNMQSGGAIGLPQQSGIAPAGNLGKSYQRSAGDDSMFPTVSGQEKLAAAPNTEALRQQNGGAGLGINPLDTILNQIQQGMAQFEVIKPLFARVQQAALQNVSPSERLLLTGAASEELNRRFLALQQTALQISDPTTGLIKDRSQESTFLASAQQYLQDQQTHLGELVAVFKKQGLEPAGGMPAPPPMTPPMGGGFGGDARITPEMKKLNDLFQEIQVEMRKFEELAPKFTAVPPTLLSQIADTSERMLLQGQASEALHQRFLSIQQRAAQITGMSPASETAAFQSEVETFLQALRQHVIDVAGVMQKHNVQAPAGLTYAAMKQGSGAGGPASGVAGSSIQGPAIGVSGAGTPAGAQQAPMSGGGGYGGISGGRPAMPVNTIDRPSTFGGGAQPTQPGQNPVGDLINNTFKQVEKHMEKFESTLRPMFQKVPPPSVLQGKLDAADLKIASGQASDALNRRLQAIQTRAQALERGGLGGPLIQAFMNDLTSFEKDLAAHIVEAERVLKEAAKITVGSSEAYASKHPTLTVEDMEIELKKIVDDVTQADERLPKTLKRLRKRMKRDLSKLEDPAVIKKEINKLAHMMDAMKTGILSAIKQIRENYDKMPIDALNHIYWNELGMDVQRYIGTMRDLDKEEMQERQAKMREESDPMAANQAAAANIDMPSMKLTGVLGTSGARSMDNAAAAPAEPGSYMQRGMAQGSMAAQQQSNLPYGSQPAGIQTGNNNPPAASGNAWGNLPKLQVKNMEL